MHIPPFARVVPALALLLAGCQTGASNTRFDALAHNAPAPASARALSSPSQVRMASSTVEPRQPTPTAPPNCDGVDVRLTRATGPDPVSAGRTERWTATLQVTACQDVGGVTLEADRVDWTAIWATTTNGTIGVRKLNRKEGVRFWETGPLRAGEVATLTLRINGTVDRKAPCGSELPLTGEWTATADGDGGPVAIHAAGPLAVRIAGC